LSDSNENTNEIDESKLTYRYFVEQSLDKLGGFADKNEILEYMEDHYIEELNKKCPKWKASIAVILKRDFSYDDDDIGETIFSISKNRQEIRAAESKETDVRNEVNNSIISI